MSRKGYTWIFDPQHGGNFIPESMRESIREEIVSEFDKLGLSKNKKIDVRFKAQFCYVDAWEENDSYPTHLFQLRYIPSQEKWSVAFFAYSSEKYEPSFFLLANSLAVHSKL